MTTKNLERLAWALGAVVAVMTAFLVITSCNSEMIVDPAGNSNSNKVLLHIKAGVSDAHTRVESLKECAFGLLKGDKFAVVVGESEDGTTYSKTYEETYTVTDNDKNVSTETPYAFEDFSTVVTVCGIAPWNLDGYANPAIPNDFGDFTFTVQKDQILNDAYQASDLLISEPVTASCSSPTAALTFLHRLSRISVTWNGNNTYFNEGSMDVSLLNILPTAQFHSILGTTRAPYGATGTKGSILLKSGINSDLGCHGIIPPQTITAGTEFIQIGYYDSNAMATKTYKATLPNDFTFKSGYSYGFTLTFTDGLLDVSAVSVETWTSGGSNTEIPFIIN